jgi:hypothetical protein
MDPFQKQRLVWLLEELAADSKTLGDHYFMTDVDQSAAECFDRVSRAKHYIQILQQELP